ncbi:MAG: tyrosine-type recombinase/integrase [Pyrinomonadaceae bacterium]
MSTNPSTSGQNEPQSVPLALTETGPQEAALLTAIDLWANASTGVSSRRRGEVLQSKQKVVRAFFDWVKKKPGEVEPTDVQAWCDLLRKDGKRPATIYARISFLSSFYRWALSQPEVGAALRQNPALLARPKRVRPYQSEATKAWTDEELQAITAAISKRAMGDDLVAKRDLALLLMYTSTGLRREEVMSLRGSDIRVEEDSLIIGSRVKGGRYRAREVRDPDVRKALLDYLTAAKRLHVLKTDAPVWTRHDHAKLAGEALTSHAFVRNLKLYAKEAGLDHAHLHQTRHTFARIVSEETGSMTATQDALDHADLSTTAVYVQRIAIKRDLHSAAVARRRRGDGAV